MHRRAVVVTLCGALLAVLCAVVATSGTISLAARAPTVTWDLPDRRGEPLPPSGLADGLTPQVEESGPDPLEIPDFVSTILKVIGIALIAATVITLWNNRPRVQLRQPSKPEEFDLLDEVAAAIAADADRQRALLERGEARNAIVACWLRLEQVITDAGLERRPSDTAQEFTARVLNRFEVDAESADRLAALYLEARFSSHEMTEQQRNEAIDALDAIHRGLSHSAESTSTGRPLAAS